MLGDAVISPCGTYRYALQRHRDFGAGSILFVMLNPSIADGQKDDPTIRRCVDFAWQWGYKSLWVTNAFAYRATDPKQLRRAIQPVGPDWEVYTSELARNADKIICAWGGNIPHYRHVFVAEFLRQFKPLHVLGLTKKGMPKHPLYLHKKTMPVLWKDQNYGPG